MVTLGHVTTLSVSLYVHAPSIVMFAKKYNYFYCSPLLYRRTDNDGVAFAVYICIGHNQQFRSRKTNHAKFPEDGKANQMDNTTIKKQSINNNVPGSYLLTMDLLRRLRIIFIHEIRYSTVEKNHGHLPLCGKNRIRFFFLRRQKCKYSVWPPEYIELVWLHSGGG